MDAGDLNAAMGGFFLGQMFAGQTQAKPVLLRFISVRVDRTVDILTIIAEVIKDAFIEVPLETELKLDFTNKAELKVWKKNKSIGERPLFTFGLCAMAWTKKDNFLTLGIRSENGAPMEMNMSLLRHLLLHLDANKIKYELW